MQRDDSAIRASQSALPANRRRWLILGAGPGDGYRPDAARQRGVYWLAGLMVLIAWFGAAGAWGHLNLLRGPVWARGAVFVALLVTVYAVWMVSLPDWSTVRVGSALFALIAALEGAIFAIVVATPSTETLPLGLDEVRRAAPHWCGINLLLSGLVTYISGRYSARWRAAIRRGG